MPKGSVRITGSLQHSLNLGLINLPGAMKRAAEDERDELVRAIKAHTPVRTGRLRDSITPYKVWHVPFTRVWRTGAKSDKYYAAWVEYGTPPRTIVAKNGGWMKFMGRNGKPVYARKINHPGTRAARMFAKGAAEFQATQKPRLNWHLNKWKVESKL